MPEILNTSNIEEDKSDSSDEPNDVRSDLTAQDEPASKKRQLDFHVTMNDYTFDDMEELIVEAAALKLLGRHNQSKLGKDIEAKILLAISGRVNEVLADKTLDLMDQPLTFIEGKDPLPLREHVAFLGKTYLEDKVDVEGKLITNSWSGKSSMTRLEWIIMARMRDVFQKEIAAATNGMITEIRNAMHVEHKAFLQAEVSRFREGIKKAIDETRLTNL